MDDKNNSLIKALFDCAAACNRCASACLGEENVKMLTQCISLDLDCADICTLTMTLFARNSAHAPHLLKECAGICTACADQCDKHADMHDHCRACSEACRKCAEACLSYQYH